MENKINLLFLILLENSMILVYIFIIFRKSNIKIKMLDCISVVSINILNLTLLFLNYGATLIAIKYGILLEVLLIVAIVDIKTKKIPLSILIFLAILGIVLQQFEFNTMYKLNFLFMLFLICGLFILRFITHNGIGKGDIYIIVLLNLFLTPKKIILVLLIAAILSGIFGLLLMWVKKAKKNTELPFVPVLFISFEIYLVMELIT